MSNPQNHKVVTGMVGFCWCMFSYQQQDEVPVLNPTVAW